MKVSRILVLQENAAGDRELRFNVLDHAVEFELIVEGLGGVDRVENHRGRVWVDSAIGNGTRFTIVLPTADQNL